MRDPSNIMDVAALYPDFMGFIFYKQSKRFVGDDFMIPKDFPKNIKRVGVFVNEKTENVLKKVQEHNLDFVQLHGDENVAYCEILKHKVKVIKVFFIDELFDFEITTEYKQCAEYFLFDTKSENYGGSGNTFDWTLLQKYQGSTKFFLSGGLSCDNISKISEFKIKNLFAVDLNSKVETSPGLKDVKKIGELKNILNSNL